MEPVTIGAKFYSSDTYSVEAIIKPTENVAGAVIRTASVSGTHLSGLITGTVAPKLGSDYDGKPILMTLGSGSQNLSYPIQLPPGYGLWITANSSTPSRACVTYDLLP
ncbi:hypothetical protein HKK52_06035 [Pseudomonas sp. ADAK2]|uniref:hypothetical protein n=1 Tax=unclassified Pseudomonas TaxID=196821 RepID=UPI001463D703|nr:MULTISPECIES: hypothetical protein [unclassified Pseudomonas]QJI40492.1 hypothetical protein HKK53_06030 [Pseudomonas sp. ADAK7]QJI46797.1 hypothetical protein HKK52_06035 [Pseudomonas sp. ADAK2]